MLKLAAAAVIVLAFSTPSRSEVGVSKNQIVIGSCSALTGPNNFFGTQMTSGGRAYFNMINANGGINGRKIVFKYYDDHYDPDPAIACFHKLIDEGVFATALFTGSAASAKHVVLADENKVPAIGFYSGPQLIYNPLRHDVFTVRASYHDEIDQMVDHLWNDAGLRRFGIIYQVDAYGADLLEGLKKALKKHGAEPVVIGSHTRNEVDVDQGLKSVEDAKPDAVLLAVNYTPASVIIKEANAAGFKPLWFLNSGAGTEAFTKLAGKEGDGTIISEVVPPFYRTDLPTVARYRKLMKKYFPKEEPSFASLRGYLAAMVLVRGIRKAGKNLTREKLVSAIEAIKNWKVGLGPDFVLNYGSDDHQGAHNVFFTVLRDGKLETITDWKKLVSK